MAFQLQIHKHGKTVRLFTMTAVDWTARYPWIVEGAMALQADAALINAECCIAGDDGVTQLDALQEGRWLATHELMGTKTPYGFHRLCRACQG